MANDKYEKTKNRQEAVKNCAERILALTKDSEWLGFDGLDLYQASAINDLFEQIESLDPDRGATPRVTVPKGTSRGSAADMAVVYAWLGEPPPKPQNRQVTRADLIPLEGPYFGGHNTDEPDTIENTGFSGTGELMQSLYAQSKNIRSDDRLEPLRFAAAAVGTGVGSEGGFAIPTQFVERTLREDLGDTVLLQRCDRQVMDKTRMLVPMFSDKDHSTSAPYGITWRKIPEGDSFGDAQGTIMAGLLLEAHKSGAMFYINNEWLDDTSLSMRSRLENIFSTSLRWYVESLLWGGTGAGEALGAIAAPGTLEIGEEAGQAANTIVTENIVKMWARLLPGSHSRAIWAANSTCFPSLATLTLAVGAGGSVTSLLQTGAASGIGGAPSTSILGRPLFFSEHLPAIGNAGDVMLLDPLMYLLGDRRIVTLDASQDYRFGHDQTAFRAKVRFDGQPILDDVFTPANGDTCGWAVKIGDRS